ncbi:MAG: DUF1707 SHOCT-like domain-containing protein [Acidimicrobiales bacterium]
MTGEVEPSATDDDITAAAGGGCSVPARAAMQRVSDADRDRTVNALRDHVVLGRLTLDEYSERVAAALVARTQGDLEPLLADLPAGEHREQEIPVHRPRRWMIAIMGGATAKGRWRASGHTTAIAVMGSCDLDLRQAEIQGSEMIIDAISIMGGVNIVVPEGFDVELVGFSIMGGRHSRIRDVPIIPGSPRIRVRAFPVMGGVEVKSRPGRNAFPAASGSSARSLDLSPVPPAAPTASPSDAEAIRAASIEPQPIIGATRFTDDRRGEAGASDGGGDQVAR